MVTNKMRLGMLEVRLNKHFSPLFRFPVKAGVNAKACFKAQLNINLKYEAASKQDPCLVVCFSYSVYPVAV